MVVLTQEYCTCRARTSRKWSGAVILQVVPIVPRFLDSRCQGTHGCDSLHRNIKERGLRGGQGQSDRHSKAAWPATAECRARSFEFRKAGVTGRCKTGDRQSLIVSPYITRRNGRSANISQHRGRGDRLRLPCQTAPGSRAASESNYAYPSHSRHPDVSERHRVPGNQRASH